VLHARATAARGEAAAASAAAAATLDNHTDEPARKPPTKSSDKKVPKPFKCSICTRGFARSSALSRHQESHVIDREFPCAICGKMFKGPHGLGAHRYRMHNNKKTKA